MKAMWNKLKKFISAHRFALFAIIILFVIGFKIYDSVMIYRCHYESVGFVHFDDNKKHFKIAAKELYEFYEEATNKDPNIKELVFEPNSVYAWRLEYKFFDDAKETVTDFLLPESMANCREGIRNSLYYNTHYWIIKVYDGCVLFKSPYHPFVLYSDGWSEPNHGFSDEDFYISRKGLHWFTIHKKP